MLFERNFSIAQKHSSEHDVKGEKKIALCSEQKSKVITVEFRFLRKQECWQNQIVTFYMPFFLASHICFDGNLRCCPINVGQVNFLSIRLIGFRLNQICQISLGDSMFECLQCAMFVQCAHQTSIATSRIGHNYSDWK